MPKPLIVIPGDEDQNRGYRIGRWHEYVNYECIYCQYSTLWEEKMIKHQAESTHPWAYPGQNQPGLKEEKILTETEPKY